MAWTETTPATGVPITADALNEFRHAILEREHARDAWNVGDLSSEFASNASLTVDVIEEVQDRTDANYDASMTLDDDVQAEVWESNPAASWTIDAGTCEPLASSVFTDLRYYTTWATKFLAKSGGVESNVSQKKDQSGTSGTCAASLTAVDGLSYGSGSQPHSSGVSIVVVESSTNGGPYRGRQHRRCNYASWETPSTRVGYTDITDIDVDYVWTHARLAAGVIWYGFLYSGIDVVDVHRNLTAQSRIGSSAPSSWTNATTDGNQMASRTWTSGYNFADDGYGDGVDKNSDHCPITPGTTYYAWTVGTDYNASGSGMCADIAAWEAANPGTPIPAFEFFNFTIMSAAHEWGFAKG